jgi:hypothetical protein
MKKGFITIPGRLVSAMRMGLVAVFGLTMLTGGVGAAAASTDPTDVFQQIGNPQLASQVSAMLDPLPDAETVPPGAIETYPGSGAYLVDPEPVMDAYVAGDQSRMGTSGIDVARLIGVKKGDALLKLKDNTLKRLALFERAGYHELDGNIALGSLVLTSLKDGRIYLSADPDKGYYELTRTQQNYLYSQPVAGEGGPTTLTLDNLLQGGILNTDKAKTAALITKYQGKLVTQSNGELQQPAAVTDTALSQEVIQVPRLTDSIGFPIPKGAYDAMMKMVNNDFSALVNVFGMPTSPFFFIESRVLGQSQTLGLFYTERGSVTFNPRNDAANQWQVGLFQAKLYDTIRRAVEVPTPAPAATETPKSIENTALYVKYKYGYFYELKGGPIDMMSLNDDGLIKVLDRLHERSGMFENYDVKVEFKVGNELVPGQFWTNGGRIVSLVHNTVRGPNDERLRYQITTGSTDGSIVLEMTREQFEIYVYAKSMDDDTMDKLVFNDILKAFTTKPGELIDNAGYRDKLGEDYFNYVGYPKQGQTSEDAYRNMVIDFKVY